METTSYDQDNLLDSGVGPREVPRRLRIRPFSVPRAACIPEAISL